MSASTQSRFDTADHYLRLASCVSDYMSLSAKRFRLVHELCTRLPEGAQILEIGVCYGHTAIMLASFAKQLRGRYTGIDRWNDTSPSSRRYVQNTFDGLGLADYATLIEGDSRVTPWAQFPLDFLLIDGGHDEECVASDIQRFLSFVTPGGFVAFDDYDAEWDPQSPCRAVKRFADLACTPDRWREAGFVLDRKYDWNTVDCGLKAWQRIR